MDPHVLFPGVGDGVVAEGDAALLQLIGEMKLVKHFELAGRIELRLFSCGESVQPFVKFWIAHFGEGGVLRAV